MREIKFRGWNTITKTMLDLKAITPLAIRGQFEDGIYLPFTKEVILMQYTGLCDKNGKEICDGDIVGLFYGIPPKRDALVIEYADDEIVADISVSGWWMRNLRKKGCSASLCKTYENDIEIIGNIHENPELLENQASAANERNGG